MTSAATRAVLGDGSAAVQSLRRALRDLLGAAGAEGLTPQEVSRRFSIDKTLAWRIVRAIREEDPWEALQHIPARAGISIFVNALVEHSRQRANADAVWKALDEFEGFIEKHARDRETMEMMVSVPTRRSSERKLESFRKAGFQCNSSLLGVRASVQFASQILAPSREPGMLDVASVCGLMEFCRLRPDVPWAVTSVKNWGGAKGDLLDEHTGVVALDTDASGRLTPLVRGFCHPKDLDVRVVEQPVGTFRYMLAEGPVGYAASADVVSGRIFFATASARESFAGELGEHGAHLCAPAEELVFDLFVHSSLDFATSPHVKVFSQFPGGPQYPDPGSEHSVLPVPTDLLDLGMTFPDPPSSRIPNYHELIERFTARMGQRVGEFRAFRYRLSYPPVPALCLIRHPLLPVA